MFLAEICAVIVCGSVCVCVFVCVCVCSTKLKLKFKYMCVCVSKGTPICMFVQSGDVITSNLVTCQALLKGPAHLYLFYPLVAS
eukprot:SAG22_NODE_3201_length_1859_cov_2.027825_2_plen_84_part_00